MAVFKGRWGSYAYKFEWAGRRHERSGFTSQRVAQQAEWAAKRLAGWMPRRRTRASLEPPRVSLAEYAEPWLESIAGELAPITLASYRDNLERHVLLALGKLALVAITRADVRQLVIALRAEGYAKNTVRLARAPLSALLSDAADDGLIPANPALQVGRSRRVRGHRLTSGEQRQTVRPMSRTQRDAFLAAARTRSRHALLFEVLAKTGLRPSEAFALRAGDVDVTTLRMRIDRARVRGHEKGTKTGEARTVDLSPALAEALRRVLPADPQARVFATPKGGPLDDSLVRRAFRRAARRAALPGFRLYDLRHTYASLRLAAGAPPTYVAAQLGHASPVTTFRYYARWIPAMGRRWVERDATLRNGANRRASGGGAVVRPPGKIRKKPTK